MRILRVNGDYKDSESDIGRLIHDFKCTNADDMYFGQLASRIRELKETPEGVETVCKAMEEEKTVSNKENTLRIMLNLMYNRNWGVEETMDAMGIRSEERDLYARSARYAIEKHGAAMRPLA